MRVLTTDFFNRSAVTVAPDLLGKFLVRKYKGKIVRSMITETEAYEGFDDRASHASKGRTKRTEIMFGPAGYWYVYLIYGMYELLNVVTGPEGHPSAVLIRGVEGSNGPGKLTRAFHISRYENTKPASKPTGLWIEDNPKLSISKKDILRTPRIGVAYAGEWAKKPWRFVLKQK